MTAQPQPRYVFISYARENAEVARRVISSLASANISCWLDTQKLKVGSRNWQNAVRTAIRDADAFVLIATPESRQSEPVHLEISLAWGDGRIIYPLWAGGENYLCDCMWKAFEEIQAADIRGVAYEAGVNELIEMLGHSSGAKPRHGSGETPRNPYKGLQPFRSADSDDYFGRERFIADLVEDVRKRANMSRLVAIVGASGSGKSSAVMAGLLPRLQAGAIASNDKLVSSERWHYIAPFTPGTTPVENLSAVLSGALPNKSAAAIIEDLRHPSCRGLHRLAAQMAAPSERVVIVVDQFEEIFTQNISADEREQFINVLTTAASEPDGAAQIVLTLRGDFYDQALTDPELNRLLQAGILNVPPLSVADLVEVVRLPAEHAGLRFDDGLVNDIVFDVRDHNDAQNRGAALPLLQFTLDKLYRESQREGDGRQLTHAAYQRIGKVQGALAQHADETLQVATRGKPEYEKLVRVLFSKLVDLGRNDVLATRRRATPHDFTSTNATQTESLRNIIEVFVLARLLTADRASSSEVFYEVSHETLLHEWPWLVRWLQEHREALITLEDLKRNASLWQSTNRNSDELYRGNKLDVARHCVKLYPDMASHLDQQFLRRSTLAHRVAQIGRITAVLIAVSIALWLAVTFTQVYQEQYTKQLAKQIEPYFQQQVSSMVFAAEQLAARATSIAPNDGELALLLSIEAYQNLNEYNDKRVVRASLEQSLRIRLRQTAHSNIEEVTTKTNQLLNDDDPAWVDYVCKQVTRNLTRWEFQSFLSSLPRYKDSPYHQTCASQSMHASVTGDMALISDTGKLLRSALDFAAHDQIARATQAYRDAAAVAVRSFDPRVNNEVCWNGAIDGFASSVIASCERAVVLASYDPSFRDSRGVAYGILGKYPDAIADLSYFVQWGGATEDRNLRRQWISTLKASANPFDNTTLSELRKKRQ